jgi:transcriptional regulator with XRE-family HTH domain
MGQGMPPRPRPTKLGQKLLKIRQHLGLTQDQMAEAIGRTDSSRRSRVHEWETGKGQPDLASLLAYARLVGASTDVLIDDDCELEL